MDIVYIYIYLEPNWPLFGRVDLPFYGSNLPKYGAPLGSRWYVFLLCSHYEFVGFGGQVFFISSGVLTWETWETGLMKRCAPRKINMEPENTPLGGGKSSSKPSFSGSMLISAGVNQLHFTQSTFVVHLTSAYIWRHKEQAADDACQFDVDDAWLVLASDGYKGFQPKVVSWL